MPLFPRTDPELRPLIAYIVARAEDRGITVNRTKLVKLLYLIDVERARSRRDSLTGLEWVFSHHGPYAELIDTLATTDATGLTAQTWKHSRLYDGATGAPDGSDWPAPTKGIVDRVMDRFAALDLNALLDHVYFHTGPMIHAERGEPLDMARARDDRAPGRRPPLHAPDRPADVDRRLAEWRSKTARRLATVALDPPGLFLDDPDEDLAGEGVRGRLHVPAGSEL
jgi:hypothetical protein